jgi:hypothetical protein
MVAAGSTVAHGRFGRTPQGRTHARGELTLRFDAGFAEIETVLMPPLWGGFAVASGR